MIITNERELAGMRAAGGVAAQVLSEVAAFISPGMTTKAIDDYAGKRIAHYGGKSAFLGYQRYPCQICISVNEEVVHGMAGERRVQFGDIISLDVGVLFEGYIGDNARTVPVGGCDILSQKLIDVTEKALYEGISRAIPGNRVVDISRAIQTHVESHGFSIVREYVGHGVGRSLHEQPQIPNYVDPRCDAKLKKGMTLAIEPMVNAGQAKTKRLGDGWTVVTIDGMPSAHFEHTILVTDGEPEILTWPEQMPSKLKAS